MITATRRYHFVRICDFCGGAEGEVKMLIASQNATHICDECVAVCVGVVADHARENEAEAVE